MSEVQEVITKLEKTKTNLEKRMNGNKCCKSGCEEYGSMINALGVGIVFICGKHASEWSMLDISRDGTEKASKATMNYDVMMGLLHGGHDIVDPDAIQKTMKEVISTRHALGDAFIKWVNEP